MNILNHGNEFNIEKYRLNSQLKSYKKNLDNAIRIVKEALSKNIAWYVAWSGGKDSTVLAHLINSIFPGMPIWSEKDDCDFPGEIDYVEKVAKKYGFNLTIHKPNELLWEFIKNGNIDICEDLHSRSTQLSDKYFYSAIEKQEKKYDGVFLGLRVEESRARLRNYGIRGSIYQRKNGKYTCCPLALWSGTDIFSYLVVNDIPILDIYYKTKYHKSSEDIRKAWMLPSKQACRGYCAWLRYYYPEMYDRLVMIFPKVRSYV